MYPHARLRLALTKFYASRKSDKLGNLDRIVERYDGRVVELWASLGLKYTLPPTTAVQWLANTLDGRTAVWRLSEPCTICLEIPTSGEVVTTLPCCHWYHTECIREWLLHARLCPLCKTVVWICSEAGSVPSLKSTVTFTEDPNGNEPETEPEDMTMKEQILHKLARMNTGDLLRQIRRNISSYQVLSDADLTWDAEDMATEPEISFAVRELQAYFSDWQRTQTDKFWQRKSHKVVIAVVVCEQEDSSLVALRGMNTEVSLPSGSLCAERAGIARAASEFFAAKSIKAIAVLDPSGDIAPLWPCEVCQSWLAKIREQNPRISVVAFPSRENDFKTVLVQKNGKDVRPPTAVSRRSTVTSKHTLEES
eukprot:s31_g7.t2